MLNLSAKGKVPWITYNGEEKADSYFCIQYLTSIGRSVDLDKELNIMQKAISHGVIRTLEESYIW